MNHLALDLYERPAVTRPATSAFIADDQASVTLADARALFRSGIYVVGATSRADELEDALASSRFDVVVLDPMMAGGAKPLLLIDGALRATQARVVVYSSIDSAAVAGLLLRRGACAFVCKRSGPETLARAIMEAKSGRKFVDPRIELEGSPPPWLSLTESERALAQALFQGSAIKRIALECGRHYSTVYSLRARLLRKLGLRSDTDLLHYIYRNGLARFLES